MRKSTSSRRARLAYAGFATGTVVTAVFVAPQAAFAAATAVPSVGPVGTSVTITEDTPAAGFTAAGTVAVQLQAGTSCNTTALAASTSVFAATSATKTATTVTFNVPPTTALVASTGATRTYAVCLYTAAAAGSAAVPLSSTPTFTVSATSTLSPATGASGGGNTVTVTAPAASPYFTGVTAPAAVFSQTACAALYPVSPAAGTTAAVTRSTTTATANTVATIPVPTAVLGTGTTATPYNICIYNGTTAGTSALLASTPYSVTLPAVTLSSVIGPNSAGAGVTVNSAANFLTGVTTPGVAFTTAATCPTTFPATATYAAGPPVVAGVVQAVTGSTSNARKLANNRMAVTVPALPLIGSAPTTYQACIYNGITVGTSTILASAAYTSTTVPTPTGVTPSAGPALGGSTITVTGSDFPTAAGSITATLGGSPLTNITPVSSTAFTAVTPAHSVADDVPLVVTTAAGSRVLQSAYSFTNALQITPNTAPNTTTAVDVDVLGTGFLSKTFGGAGNARVYLVDGEYDGADIGSSTWANGPVAECTNVLVISDNELICTLQLNRRLTATGALFDPVAYTRTLTTDVNTTAGSRVVSLTTGTFTQNDIGQPIVQSGNANIPAGTRIVSVLSPTQAVISANALLSTAGTEITAVIGGAAVRTATANYTLGGTTVTATGSASFSSADIGRVVTGTGIATSGAGTTITAVAAGGGSATLSQPTTAAGTGATLSLYAAGAVPNGAYNLTYVSNGDLDAETDDTDYEQSIVSSGSTFTVAPF